MKEAHGSYQQTNKKELNYIRSLGTFENSQAKYRCLTPKDRRARRIRLLRGYIASLPLRGRWWDGADPELFKREAEIALDAELLQQS